MFKVSTPRLVIEACRGGAIGAMPSGNAPTPEEFDGWVAQIDDALGSGVEGEATTAPFAINLLTHASNARFGPDFEIVKRRRVPIVIASVGAPAAVVGAVHDYG